jgi:hypothetical protein
MAHSAELPSCQIRILLMYPCTCGSVSMCTWLFTMCTGTCIHVHVAKFPHGHVSTCRWPCIYAQNLLMYYVHLFVYPHAHGCVSIYMQLAMFPYTCIRLFFCRICYVLSAILQNFVMHYAIAKNFVQCHGHSAEELTTAQNHMNFI